MNRKLVVSLILIYLGFVLFYLSNRPPSFEDYTYKGEFRFQPTEGIEFNLTKVFVDQGFTIDSQKQSNFDVTRENSMFFSRVDSLNQKMVVEVSRLPRASSVILDVYGVNEASKVFFPNRELAKILRSSCKMAESNSSTPKFTLLNLEEAPSVKSVTDRDRNTILIGHVTPSRIDSDIWELRVRACLELNGSPEIILEPKIRISVDLNNQIKVENCAGFLYGSKSNKRVSKTLSVIVNPQLTRDRKSSVVKIGLKGSIANSSKEHKFTEDSNQILNKNVFFSFGTMAKSPRGEKRPSDRNRGQ